jgi:hypothetical protein
MRNREKIFIATSILLFLFSWKFLADFFEMAKAMAEAKKDLNPIRSGFYSSIIVIIIYAAFFYFIWGMIKSFSNKK